MRTKFEENTSPDIKQAVEENSIVLLPLGCVEQHGPHLPLNSDWGMQSIYDAAEQATEMYNAKVLVLPLMPFGPAAEHTAFYGTISLSFNTWSTVVTEMIINLIRDGFKRIVVIKGCGGHLGIEGPVYQLFCEKKRLVKDLDIRIYAEQAWSEMGKIIAQSEICNQYEVHAGGVETSMVLAKTPNLVHLDRIEQPGIHKKLQYDCWWVAEDLTDNGSTGDPSRYDAVLGRTIVNRMTELLRDYIGQMWCCK